MSHTTTTATLAVDGGTPVSADPVPMVRVDITDADTDAALRVLHSGMLAQGARVAAFEERFAAMTGARHAAACANGTCALQLAYRPLFAPGDDVLCPAWTYIATASMISARGARPIFCDADPDTYTIDVADAEARLTPRTSAIAVTHLYGAPANIDAVETLARRHGLKIIYDAAQAHLATWRGKGIGAFGDAVTYSFYPTKNMTTGEGGMVTTNSPDLDSACRRLRSHGETEKYVHESIGFNYRMSDVEAAIGFSQLDRLEAATARRRENARALDSMIDTIPGLTPPRAPIGGEHVYHLYVVRLEPGAHRVDRDRFVEALRAEGVQSAVHYPRSTHRQPAFSSLPSVELPVADRLARSLFCVPVHPGLTEQQIKAVGEALAKVAGAYAA